MFNVKGIRVERSFAVINGVAPGSADVTLMCEVLQDKSTLSRGPEESH